jgi:hypothetical protein
MTSKTMYHYVYRITNIITRKYYYGKRSTTNLPHLDIGFKYFGSPSKDIFFDLNKDQKENPSHYEYKVVARFQSAHESLSREIKLHKKFNVKDHPQFYNKANQTSTGFDTTGKTTVMDKDGNKFHVNCDDPRYKSGELETLKFGWGTPGREFTAAHRENLSKAAKGVSKSKQHIENSLKTRKERHVGEGKNHWKFKRYYVTPLGTFDSPEALEPIISMTRIKMWCQNPNKKILKLHFNRCEWLQDNYTWEFLHGKTFGDIGFNNIPKEEYQILSKEIC